MAYNALFRTKKSVKKLIIVQNKKNNFTYIRIILNITKQQGDDCFYEKILFIFNHNVH
jgi:hypothetical protein